jgi:flagellar hook-length control protein FliK
VKNVTIGTLYNVKADVQFKPNTKVDFQTQTNNDVNSKKSFNQDRFGRVFNDVINAKKQQPSSNQKVDKQGEKLEVLQASNLKEALTELGIEFDESLLFVEIGNDSIPTDELLTSENLANMLEIDLEQLQQLMQQLGLEVDVNNIWAMIQAAPDMLRDLQIAFTNGNVAEEDTMALLQFIKLAQLVGEKTDTVFTQQTQLMNMSDAFKQALQALQLNANQQNQTQLAVMQQVLQSADVDQKVEATTKGSNNTQNESLLQHNQQSNQLNRTVTVTLPTNQASQAEALAKEMANLLNRSQMANSQGTIKLMLKLFPENFGQIRIEIVQQNGVMSARLLATTAAGKELLDSSLNQLKTTLVAQNIQMDRIDIAQALQETDKNFRDQSLFGNFFKQRNNEEDDKEQVEEEEQKSFDEFLTEEVQA